MATAEELLATIGNEENIIVIDSDLRTMTFPTSVKNIGVENDKDVHKLNFMMPRYFSEYDLSTFNIRINYLNAQGDGDMYVVTDPTVEEDAIYFSWLVGRHACLYRGAVTFIVCLKLADGEGDVAQEFNTTLASLQVLPGLETEPTILETDYDIIEQLLLTVQDTNGKIKAVLDSGMTAEELGNIAKEQKTLKARMDEFASLPDGSTTGDAELIDGRVGYDGTTYTNIGNAIRGQIADLKSDLTDPFLSVITSGLVERPNGVNLFNKDSDDIVSGYFSTSNGTINSSQKMSCIKIEVSTTKTYSLLGALGFFSEGQVIKIPVFNASNGEYISTKYGTLDADTSIVTVSGLDTIEGNAPTCLIGYSFLNSKIDNAFVTEGVLAEAPEFAYVLNKRIGMPAEYEARLKELSDEITDDYISVISSGLVEKPNGINLFNRKSDDIEVGKYYNKNGTDGEHATMGRLLVEVPTNGTYSLLGATTFYGASDVIKIPIYKITDKSYIGTKTGTLNPSNNIVTISELDSIERDYPTCYIGYSFKLDTLATAFISGKAETEVPNYIYKLNGMIDVGKISNVLKGKTAVFLGDSICDATAVPSSQTDYYRWGWAGRIGNANDMTWHNYGSSGASITNMTGRGCIQNQLTLAISNYPDADYIILEGGTNDADVIESDPNYSIGTFDKTDYTSTYDGTTFCGALETFLRNTIMAYPTKKIGFIIPQKMGLYTDSLLRRRNLFDVAKQICQKWGVPCIDIWSDCIMNPKITTYYDNTKTNAENIASGKAYVDGQHLTDAGYDTITPSIELWMEGMR